MTETNESLNLSIEPGAVWNLTAEQKNRVAELLDDYLSRLESGLPPSRDAVLQANPDLAEPLAAYFESLDDLHDMAAGFQRPDERPGARPEERRADSEFSSAEERRLGDFRILREIGRGGMGVVYEAEQISIGRRVALKVLPFAAVLDSKQIARFKHEAQAAGQLNHPNIVSVYAVGVERGVHFYAMQLIDGQPLDRALTELRQRRESRHGHLARKASRGPAPQGASDSARTKSWHRHPARNDLDGLESDAKDGAAASTMRSVLTARSPGGSDYFKTVVGLGVQAAGAIHAAHECGIVHRDIKPSNLLLDGYGKLWVTDFGLARRESDATLTRTGDLVGTMRYMSPEQATGQVALVDYRTDIYSLGATLYELLTLEPVFAEHEGPALLRQIELHDPCPPRKLQPKIPADLQTVVLKAMAKRREDRYTTAADLADDLQHVLDGKPIVARPPTALDRLSRWSMRHREVVAAAAVVCLVTLLGLAASTVLFYREKKQADDNLALETKSFHDALDTVECLGVHLWERLGNVPDAGPIRQNLLRQTLGYYRGFVEQSKDKPPLRADLALSYSKIGSLSAAIGSNADAIEADAQAIQLYQELAATNPRDSECRRRLGVCQNNLGLVLTRSGKMVDARRAFSEAIRSQQEVLDSSDNREQCVSGLALAHSNLGLLQHATGDSEAAAVSFARATGLLEQLLAAAPENTDCMRDLAAALNNLGSLYVERAPAQAIEQYQRAAALQRKAAALRKDDAFCRSELALTYNNLGAVQARRGAAIQAAESYSSAVEIENELLQKFPAQKSYRHTLAVGYNNLGLAQSKQGATMAAEASYRRALSLQEALVGQDPHDVEMQSSLGGMCNNLGVLLEDSDHKPEAVKAFQKAVEHQKQALAQAPDVARYRQFLSKHYYNYARALRSNGRVAESVAIALARRDLWPHSPQHLFGVAEELALAAKDLSVGPSAAMSAETCGKLAIDTLKQAKAEGWKPQPNSDWTGSFASIKNRPEFLMLKN